VKDTSPGQDYESYLAKLKLKNINLSDAVVKKFIRWP
jgi:hypothetical protein